MNSFLKKLFGGVEKNSLVRWHATRCVLCSEKIFEASVCDLTKGWHLGALGEVMKWAVGEEESFGVRLLYDSDLSQMVG